MIIAMKKTNVQNRQDRKTQENERLRTRRTYQFRIRNRSVQTEALDAGSASTVPERWSKKRKDPLRLTSGVRSENF
ncbi:hypothetical protein LR48_Vigan07g257500 [Vigna angularis]|uniref:Uncharacterized protein n=1 Tax=Phaseolus angularis TaxID=3914 RepID=A0A0L9V1N5_PHAAN|nr:hypothetical protein LR48_Vigan07g257500 [Vigna angularis]